VLLCRVGAPADGESLFAAAVAAYAADFAVRGITAADVYGAAHSRASLGIGCGCPLRLCCSLEVRVSHPLSVSVAHDVIPVMLVALCASPPPRTSAQRVVVSAA
jgi:hypothetical protein